MKVQVAHDNILFRWIKDKELKVKGIELLKELSRATRWAICVGVGPDSKLKVGDHLLLSARPTTFYFEIDGEETMNGSDKSTLAYKRNGILDATCGTILFTWVDPEEEITESGIVLVRREINKELETRKALVHAAGPDSGVKKGDIILIPYNKDAYTIEIDDLKMHNCGKESVICFWRK